MAGFLGDGFVVGVQSGIWWRNCSSLKLELRLMVINFVRFLDGRSPTLLWFPFSFLPSASSSYHIIHVTSHHMEPMDNLEPSPITIVAPSLHEEFYNTPRQRHVCAVFVCAPSRHSRCSFAVAIPANCVVFLMDSPVLILKLLQTGTQLINHILAKSLFLAAGRLFSPDTRFNPL